MTVIEWLLDSDPSIRWQVMADLTDASREQVAAERAKVAREGAGARLLALQAADGRWGGAAWNRGWDSTMPVELDHGEGEPSRWNTLRALRVLRWYAQASSASRD